MVALADMQVAATAVVGVDRSARAADQEVPLGRCIWEAQEALPLQRVLVVHSEAAAVRSAVLVQLAVAWGPEAHPLLASVVH